MKLSSQQFKRFKELSKKKDLTEDEAKELKELLALKNQKDGSKEKKPWGNDFAWWNKYDRLMKDATNVAMNWIPGTGFNGKIAENTLIESAGAISISVANVYGAEDTITSPVNVQSRNLWLAMHRKYRGINTYQASDLGAVVIAGVEVIATIAEIERLYGVINYYSINNRNLPYTLLAAMGVSTSLADNIRANLADFRYGLNVLLMRAQNILVPKDLSVIANKISLYGYIYSDHKSVRAQNYVFRSIATARFVATLNGGSSVVFDRTKTLKSCSTYEDVLSMLATPIAALVEDDDVNKIYSDLLAYLGNEAFTQIALLPETYITVPVYDESILHKIHNMKSLSSVVFTNDGATASFAWPVDSIVPMLYSHQNISTTDVTEKEWAITQKDNVLCTKVCLGDTFENGTRVFSGDECRWELTNAHYIPCAAKGADESLLDTYLNEMDDEHVCEGVLLKASFDDRGTSNKIYVTRSAAFELICSLEGFVNRKGIVTTLPILQYSIDSGYMAAGNQIAIYRMFQQSLLILSQFDWAPIAYRLVDDDVDNIFYNDSDLSSTGTGVNGVVFGMDIDNCRFVGKNEIYRIHETAVLSGLYTTAAATEANLTK